MKNITQRLALILSVFCLFMACKKELSVEKGKPEGPAQGELVDSLGNCKNVTIRGTYIVDTPLTNNNYVLINVNFTKTGKYKIYTDTSNGMWFLDSGYVVSKGQAVVKIKGKGSPILAKKANFTLFFNNNICSFSLSTSDTSGRGGSGGGSGGDYFPTTSGSTWTYQYLPKMGNVDTFNVTVIDKKISVPTDSLVYSQFATSMADTFYFSKDGKGTYYALSTVDFDYTLLFDSIPKYFISYPFLKENAAVNVPWESGEYGTVKLGKGSSAEYGKAKAVFTLIAKNSSPYTVGGKIYSDVINIKRDIMFLSNASGASYRLVVSGNSFYAKGYGLIDQVINTLPAKQSVSLYRTPTIK